MDDVEPFAASHDLIDLTTTIVTAYVTRNAVPIVGLPGLIAATHAALASLEQYVIEPEPKTLASAAEVRKSIKPDALISFVDGKPYKTLKRHLAGHGLTPIAYRAKYGLPADYPMTAPSYSEARSALAKRAGLGGARRNATAAKPADTVDTASGSIAADTTPVKRRGRPRKAETA